MGRKIGIISDFHLGHKNANFDSFKATVLELQQKVDIIIDCGDITDNNTLNAIDANKLYNLFQNIYKPYHIIRGNHDTLNEMTIAKILSAKENIFVYNEITKVDDLLFVPYIDSKLELLTKLSHLKLDEPCKYAFSHLSITDNIYTMIPFNDMSLKSLFKYAENWFNGHIHTPEYYKDSIFGTFTNVGSISSLTFSDEHLPNYNIIEEDEKGNYKVIQSTVKNVNIHKSVNLINNPDFDFLNFAEEHKQFNINWRIQIPNVFSYYVEIRKKVKEELLKISNTNNIQFDYVKNNTNKKTTKNNTNKQNIQPLIVLLLEQFEKDNKVKINTNIKEKLLNTMY